MYVKYNGPEITSSEDLHYYLCKYGTSLEESIRHKVKDKGSVIFAIQLVKGREFYGYHRDEELFVKIYYFDPDMRSRIIKALQVWIKGLRSRRVKRFCFFWGAGRCDVTILHSALTVLIP